MKPLPLLFPALLLTASAALAAPYTVRMLPSAIDAPGVPGVRRIKPMAADFLGNGRLQWYQGGNLISRFPDAGNITLPAITLPQTTDATVDSLAAALCDVDRDGDMDIVRINQWIGNLYEYTLQVFRNNSNGTFTLGYRADWTDAKPWEEGTHYYKIVPGDFNKDGAPDLAVMETYANVNQTTDPDRVEGKLYIRWNDKFGGFGTTSMVQPNGLEYNCRVSAADYDRDGDLDLYCSRHIAYGPDVIIGNSDRFWKSLLFKNDGTGVFAEAGIFANVMPDEMIHINNDDWVDFAGHTSNTNVPMQVSYNNGDGTFSPRTAWDRDSYASAHAYADVDQDGVTDLIAGDFAELRLNPNDPGIEGYLLATLPSSIDEIGVADSDADGDLDFFLSLNNNTFALVENQQLHTVPGASLTGTRPLSGVDGLCTADFDRNGREDLVAVTPGLNKLWFYFTQDDGLPATPEFRLSGGSSLHSAVTADFNADGFQDVAYTMPDDGAVRVAYGREAAPLFWASETVASGLPGVALLAAGTNGPDNGRPDLFTAGILSNSGIRGLSQSSSGVWSGADILTYPYPNPAPKAIAVGRHSAAPGDELAYMGSYGLGNEAYRAVRGLQRSIGWIPLGGAGVDELITTGDFSNHKLLWADASGDAADDVIYLDGSGGLSSWNPTAGATTVLIPGPAGIRDIQATDWDRDGRTDILAATEKGLTLFHFSRAQNQWLRSDLYDASATGGYLLVAPLQLDRDGYPDAVAYGTLAGAGIGRLDYFKNVRFNLRGSLAAQAASVTVAPGTTATALTVPLRSAGRMAESGGPADASVQVTQFELLLQEAVSGPGGSWVPGGPLNSAFLGSAISTVSLQAGSVTIASASSSAVIDTGILYLNHTGTTPLAAIAPGVSLDHRVRFTVKAAAAQQTLLPRFFVTVRDITSQAVSGGPLNLNVPGSGPKTLLQDNKTVLVTIQQPLTALQQWRQTNFGVTTSTGSAANDADPDGDGVPNLMEYVMGNNPRSTAGITPNLALRLTSQGQNLPLLARMTLLTDYDSKIRLTIERSTSMMAGQWTALSTRTGTGAWTGVLPTTTASPDDSQRNYLFNTGAIPATTPRYFLRVRAEELP